MKLVLLETAQLDRNSLHNTYRNPDRHDPDQTGVRSIKKVAVFGFGAVAEQNYDCIEFPSLARF